MIVNMSKPMTPEELVHFGVKGMRWGVRKDRNGSESSGKKAKPTSKDIRDARTEVNRLARKVEYKALKENMAFTKAEKRQAEDELRKAIREYEDSPAWKTASKMTKGEKFTSAILGTMMIGTIAVGALSIYEDTRY